MRLRRWLVTVIPPSNQETRSFGVSTGTLKASLLILIVSMLLSGLWVAEYISALTWRQRAAELQVENEYLQKSHRRIRADITGLTAQIRELSLSEDRLRQVFGLAEVSEGIRSLGVGGIDYPSVGRIPEYQKQILNTDIRLSELERLVELESETWKDAEYSLYNRQELLRHTPSILPTDAWMSRGFGNKIDPFSGNQAFHSGIDLACNKGTMIVAPADGRVEYAGWKAGLGIMVKIDHGFGFATIFAHMSKHVARTGDRLKRGDKIGEVGATGHTTGPHLHYEVWKDGRPKNPLHYISSRTYGDTTIVD